MRFKFKMPDFAAQAEQQERQAREFEDFAAHYTREAEKSRQLAADLRRLAKENPE